MRLRLLLGAELALRLTSLASLLPQPRRRHHRQVSAWRAADRRGHQGAALAGGEPLHRPGRPARLGHRQLRGARRPGGGLRGEVRRAPLRLHRRGPLVRPPPAPLHPTPPHPHPTVLCVCDETVLDPLFSTVSRPFRTAFRGLGAGFWNLGSQTEKTAKKREKTEQKWARNGLKKVGPMTD